MTTRLLVTVTDGTPLDVLMAVTKRLSDLRCHVEELGPEESPERSENGQ